MRWGIIAALTLFFETAGVFPAWAQPAPRPAARPAPEPPPAARPVLPAVPPARPAEPAAAPQSEPPRPPPETLAAIRSRGALLVCVWPGYYGLTYRNPRTAELEGLDVDMARALAARLGAQLRFVETGFPELADRLEARECDVAMTGVGITPARQARLAFTKPYLASPVYAVANRDGPRVRRWEELDAQGTVIAVSPDSVMEGLARETLRRSELLVVRPPRTLEAEVLSGRADAFLHDYPYTRGLIAAGDWARLVEPPARFGETLYGYAVPRGQTAWLAELNNFLTAMKADGTLARAAQRHGLGAILVN